MAGEMAAVASQGRLDRFGLPSLRCLFAPFPDLCPHIPRFEHIEDQSSGDSRQLFPVKTERNQTVLDHLDCIKRQRDRELLGVGVALSGHSQTLELQWNSIVP